MTFFKILNWPAHEILVLITMRACANTQDSPVFTARIHKEWLYMKTQKKVKSSSQADYARMDD